MREREGLRERGGVEGEGGRLKGWEGVDGEGLKEGRVGGLKKREGVERLVGSWGGGAVGTVPRGDVCNEKCCTN